MVRHLPRVVLLLLLSSSASAGDFNIYLGNGKSETNRHGQSRFRTISFELTGRPRLLESLDRYLPDARAGVDIDYSAVRQPRSWFGYTYGDPDDSVRAEWAHVFIRNYWRASSNTLRPSVVIGSGPMWSNRRIPAATSKCSFNSLLALGVVIFPNARIPLSSGYP